MTKREADQPVAVRQQLSAHEPGAHLWAPFFLHWKGGVASMLPFVVVFFTTQPFSTATMTVAVGGYTVVPAVVGITATLWAAMSVWLLHMLRFRDSLRLHLVVYGVVGAVLLTALAAFATSVGPSLWTALITDMTFLRDNDAAMRTVLLAPLVGGIGAVIGRWLLDSGITWCRLVVREPLPDVFTFVDRKRDKDDFKRL